MKRWEVWGFDRHGEKDCEVVLADTAEEAVASLRPYGFRARVEDATEVTDGKTP